MDLDPDDFLCDFEGTILKLRQWALLVRLYSPAREVWLQRQKTVVEERTTGELIIHIPASVADGLELEHPFLEEYIAPVLILNPKPISEFNLSLVNYDEGIDDGYVG